MESDDKYVKRFIRKTQKHKELISNRNPVLFDNDINIIKTVNYGKRILLIIIEIKYEIYTNIISR